MVVPLMPQKLGAPKIFQAKFMCLLVLRNALKKKLKHIIKRRLIFWYSKGNAFNMWLCLFFFFSVPFFKNHLGFMQFKILSLLWSYMWQIVYCTLNKIKLKIFVGLAAFGILWFYSKYTSANKLNGPTYTLLSFQVILKRQLILLLLEKQ